MDSAKDVQHKKRHEVLNATPANTEVIMKRVGLYAASVHYTESILLTFRGNVKDNSGKNSQLAKSFRSPWVSCVDKESPA